jgi:predicted RNA polymerase sigma factor
VPALDASEIDRVFRDEYGRAVAVLVRVFGDIDVAEAAVQDAFTAAASSTAPRLSRDASAVMSGQPERGRRAQ